MTTDPNPEAMAAAMRDACVREVERAWVEASMQGLCGEGAMEYALDRLRHLKPADLVAGTSNAPSVPGPITRDSNQKEDP